MTAGRSAGVSLPLLILLSLASSVSPFGMTVLVPNLNALAISFQQDYGQVQFLISVYLFGLAVAQPLAGALGDRFGRRPVLLVGLALFVAASLACAVATRFDLLILLRFLQAVGVSVGTVCSRAILRDRLDEAASAEANSYVAAAMGFAPIVAPVIGGLAGAEFGPQSVFTFSALIALAIWIGIYRHLPETRRPEHRVPVNFSEYRRNYGRLLSSGVFVGYTLLFGFGQGIFFAFMAVGAPVFETYLKLGQREFGLVWGMLAIGYVVCATLGGRLARRFAYQTLLLIAACVACAAGWTLWVVTVTDQLSAFSLIGLLVILISVNGIITPLSLAGAVSYRPLIAGTASGLSSSIGLVTGGAFTIIAGSVYSGSFLPVALLMAIACTLAMAMVLLIRYSRA